MTPLGMITVEGLSIDGDIAATLSVGLSVLVVLSFNADEEQGQENDRYKAFDQQCVCLI